MFAFRGATESYPIYFRNRHRTVTEQSRRPFWYDFRGGVKGIGYSLDITSDSWPRGGGTSYDGLYMEVPPKRGTFFKRQVYDRVRISLVVVCKR